MAAEMVFKLGANVGEAVQGMNLVQQRVQYLENSIKYFQEKLANTQSQKFYATALEQIAKKKQELAQITRATGGALDKSNDSTRRATSAMTDLGRVVQDAPYGFVGIANNINPLIESFGRLKSSTGSAGGAFKALLGSLAGPAGIGLAISVGTSLLVAFGDQIFGTGKKAEKTAEQTDKLKNSIDGIYSGVAKEAANVGSLIAILQNETETRERKLAAIKELQQIQPEVFKNLKLEGNEVIGLNGAYANYIANLKNVVAAKIKQAQLEQTLEKLLKAQGVTATGIERDLLESKKKEQENSNKSLENLSLQIDREDDLYGVRAKIAADRKKQNDQEKAEINSLQKEVQRLTNDLTELSKVVEVPEIKPPKVGKVKVDKKKVEKDIQGEFDKIQVGFDVVNPVLQALQAPEILTEAQKIGKLINQSIEKNIKPLKPSAISPNVTKALEKQKTALENQLELGKNVANGISNAFGQAFGSILEGENVFTALGKSLKGFVLELVQATIKALIFRAIVNAFVPGGSQALGATGIANLLGFRANGGPVTGQAPYIVGERGPELFVPSVSGNILPNNQLGSFNGRPAFATSMGGRSIVRGNDILLASARTQRSQNRVNA